MSEIRANTVSDAAGTGPATLTGQSAAKVSWRYDQTTPSIVDSFNVSSVSDDTTGEYTVSYTNSFANTNYIPVTHCIHVDSGAVLSGANVEGSSGTGPALNLLVGEVSIIVQNSNGSNLDMDFSSGLINGDLA